MWRRVKDFGAYMDVSSTEQAIHWRKMRRANANAVRRQELDQIQTENTRMLHRLQNTASTFTRFNFERHQRDSREYLRLLDSAKKSRRSRTPVERANILKRLAARSQAGTAQGDVLPEAPQPSPPPVRQPRPHSGRPPATAAGPAAPLRRRRRPVSAPAAMAVALPVDLRQMCGGAAAAQGPPRPAPATPMAAAAALEVAVQASEMARRMPHDLSRKACGGGGEVSPVSDVSVGGSQRNRCAFWENGRPQKYPFPEPYRALIRNGLI